MYVYLLQHSYLIDQEQDIYETKIIGIYSSEKNAKNVLEAYRKIWNCQEMCSRRIPKILDRQESGGVMRDLF